ncbi:MAG: hypothetical protein EOM50_09045 [Erysipelotrichia bacterium]|nr:hypothetical protein [Erysipelotrichia bacterium]NCC53919.1 hypothetical protein [Erysipelotrichia bacterium]
MKKENVVYLSNESIQLIVGSDDHKDMIKIYQYKSYPFNEGTMINGVITDEFEIKNTLKQLVEEGIHEVNLVIDSGQILSKNIAIPKLKESEIYGVIKDELSSLGENSEDLVYDYAYIGSAKEGKGMQILACAVERKLISNYLEIFTECGIKIKGIDFSINILRKLMKEIHTNNDDSYLISLIDGNNLTSVLFEHNQYKLSYRSRIVNPRKTILFEQEVASNLANIYQFSVSGENSVPIQRVYFCGLHKVEEGLLQRMENNLNIPAQILEKPSSIYIVNNQEGFHLDKYILPVGYLFKK